MAGQDTDLLIAGGGPAGMMAKSLFARAGLRELVLEKHGEFRRDFRGDTVHPSTLRLFYEVGLHPPAFIGFGIRVGHIGSSEA
jgi:2-polyprenyl-6-methoxyphenol hydroxylase-like FAD-dependent oxidoreductase